MNAPSQQPLLPNGVEVNLPETPKPKRMPDEEQRVEVALRGDGTLFVGQAPVARAGLLAALVRSHAEAPESVVVVKADRSLPYRAVREVLRTVEQAGFPGASLETRQRALAP